MFVENAKNETCPPFFLSTNQKDPVVQVQLIFQYLGEL